MHLSLVRSFLLFCLLSFLAHAQTARVPSLHQLGASAGYIFSGTVLAVERAPALHPNEVETVRVTFRVEEGVRGVRSRQTLTIREWAGLWSSGARYRPGERVVLMLYPLSPVGLTSPVGGGMGKFTLDDDGNLASGQNEGLMRDPAVEPWMRGKSHASGRDLVRVLRRVVKE